MAEKPVPKSPRLWSGCGKAEGELTGFLNRPQNISSLEVPRIENVKFITPSKDSPCLNFETLIVCSAWTEKSLWSLEVSAAANSTDRNHAESPTSQAHEVLVSIPRQHSCALEQRKSSSQLAKPEDHKESTKQSRSSTNCQE